MNGSNDFCLKEKCIFFVKPEMEIDSPANKLYTTCFNLLTVSVTISVYEC